MARAPVKPRVDDDPNDLAQIAKAVRALEKHSIANVLEIGRLLQIAYDQCEHGDYLDWLEAQFGWSYRTALRYRNAFNFQKCHNVTFENLNLSLSAVYLVSEIDENPTARDAIIEAAKTGRVSLRIARKIVADHQPPDNETVDDVSEDEATPPRPHRKTTRKTSPLPLLEIIDRTKLLKPYMAELKLTISTTPSLLDDKFEKQVRAIADELQRLKEDLLSLLPEPEQGNGANKLN